MQLLSCHVCIGGDDDNIVVKDHDTAVTFPELLILKALHGDESVRSITDLGDVERDPEEERQRLLNLYGAEIVRQVFPVAHQELPEMDKRLRRQAAVPAELREDEPEPVAEAKHPRTNKAR